MTYALDDILTVSQLLEGGLLQEFQEYAREKQTFDDAVDEFTRAMKDKLLLKALQGYSGGLEPENAGNVMVNLLDHWQKFTAGDRTHLVDIANLLMMLWTANHLNPTITADSIKQREEEDMPL